MPRVQYCIPCATGTRPVETIATQTVDGDPMCDFHAREEQMAGVPAEEVKRPIALVAPIAPAPQVDPEPGLLCVACESVNIVTPATTGHNGDPMCEHHAFMARRKMLVKTCSRGCGKPAHRGRCAGAEGRRATLPPQRMASTREIPVAKHKPSAAALEAVARANTSRDTPAAPAQRQRAGKGLAELVSREIALPDVPLRTSIRPPRGRMGKLWAWLCAAKGNVALEVECRDSTHLHHTHRDLRIRAKKMAIQFFWTRIDNKYYISRSKFEGGVRAWE